MRFIKLLLISVIVLFLILTTIAALLPSDVRISRAIDINRPASVIYKEVAYLRNWENWNLYVQKMEGRQIAGDSIKGKKLTITLVERKPTRVISEWKQLAGKNFTGGFNLIAHDSLTTVQWYFDFHFNWYPWEKFSSIVYDQQVGPAMQSSLENLKSSIENHY